MSFNTTDRATAVILFRDLGEPVTYRRCNGQVVSTYAEIDLDVEVFGETESGATEYRTEIALLRADVGVPKRGDSIITADGTTYTVRDLLPVGSDKVDARVSAK